MHPVIARQTRTTAALAAALILLAGCDGERAPNAPPPSPELAASPVGWSEWSPPVNLGAPVNSPVADANAVLSTDGLSLYYDSDRTDLPGALGGRDMWVAHRACTDHLDPRCAWQTPVNLGERINSPYGDGSPELSDDGHLLFFISHRPRENCPLDPAAPDPVRPCDEDIYVAWRSDPTDDLAWSEPVRLGPEVNTLLGDGEPGFGRNAEPGDGNLYFSRNVDGTVAGADIFSARLRIAPRGDASGVEVEVVGDAVRVDALSAPGALDGGVTVSADARELFFFSAGERPGQTRVGALDLWTSTRRSPHDPWSPPVNPGIPMNSARADLSPSLSHDGRTLLFTSNRGNPPGAGFVAWDIYMSTRTRAGGARDP